MERVSFSLQNKIIINKYRWDDGNRKSPLGKQKSNNDYRQKSPMDAKIST